jgi:hypothetical protein
MRAGSPARSLAALASIALCSCSGSHAPVGQPPPANQPPAWPNAPASLHLVQGETKSIAFSATDPDGDSVTASASAGVVEADLGSALVVHAGLNAPASDVVTVTLDDGHGGTASLPIPVTIDPLAWKPDLQWSGGAGPVGREHGTFLIDDAARTVILMGGSGYSPQGKALADFWKLDLAKGAWTAVTPQGDVPPPTASARAVRMPGTTTAYLFGGYTGDGTTDSGDLYRVDYGGGSLVFKKLVQVTPPAPRELHGFGYDPQTHTFVVFGGYSYADDVALDDTWTMQLSGDTATWARLSGAGPTGRYGFFYGTDDVAGRFIVFSGAQDPTANDSINAAQDTWALDLRKSPPVWTKVLDGSEANHAPGRRNGCYVVDPRGPSLYVFGGTSDGTSTQPGLFALDMRPSHEGWSSIDRPDQPILRSSDFGFYDANAGTVSCGFGNSTSGIYTDVATIGP